MVSQWAKDLTESVLGGPPVQIGKYYEHPEDGPIRITSGQYWGSHGLSNFWYWEVCATGEKHHGYAREWPRINVPESKALSFILNALAHGVRNNDIVGDAFDDVAPFCADLIHQCAIGRWENGYLKNDPRREDEK